ncbi:MAG: hypothetical protein IJF11_05665 [Clostridia bacterium]|nr:hypothetical protein [Clostridia bacterium]
MKKILSLILFLILCFGAFVSCDNETQTESSSESTQESISKEESAKEESALNIVTRDTFADAYESWIGWYYETGVLENNYHMFSYVKAIFDYEDFEKGIIEGREDCLTEVTEQTFEENFVLIVRGFSGHIRNADIYYTDFKKEDNYYTITYNTVCNILTEAPDAHDPFCDVCIIPKELCDNPNLEIKIIEKQYIFRGEKYSSPCEVYTKIHNVIGDEQTEQN